MKHGMSLFMLVGSLAFIQCGGCCTCCSCDKCEDKIECKIKKEDAKPAKEEVKIEKKEKKDINKKINILMEEVGKQDKK